MIKILYDVNIVLLILVMIVLFIKDFAYNHDSVEKLCMMYFPFSSVVDG